MGRALYSQKYSAPAIREELDPSADALDVPCEKWSARNQFDPDSEEFFRDAPLERFVDGPIDSPIEVDNTDEAPHVVVLESVADSSSSSSAASSSSRDNESRPVGSLSDTNDIPMAVGADDPASLLAGAYTPVDWQQRFLEAGSDSRRQGRPARIIYRGPRHTGIARQYAGSGDLNSSSTNLRGSPVSVYVPPVPSRIPPTPVPATTSASMQELVHRSPVSRRTVSITPINIPREPSLPSPVSPSTPSASTPTVFYPTSVNTFTTPSPAPNVTPRIYTWNRVPVPVSPTRDGPLTNSRARLSLSRIDTRSMAMSQHQYNAPVAVLDRRY